MLQAITAFLIACHQRWPTDRARHNLTVDLEHGLLCLTIRHGALWSSFYLEESDFVDVPATLDAIGATLGEEAMADDVRL